MRTTSRVVQIQTVDHAGQKPEVFMACAGRHDWTLHFDKEHQGEHTKPHATCGPLHPCLPITSTKPARWVFKVSEPLMCCPDMALTFGGATTTLSCMRRMRESIKRGGSHAHTLAHAIYIPTRHVARDGAGHSLTCGGCDVMRSAEPRAPSVVHLVRDPFDTAVSSYLYHSQDPTPEKWVYKLQGPCKADERAQAFLADVLSIPPSALLNVSKLYRQLYRSAMPAGRPANNYFEAMRALSVEDSVCVC